MAPRILIEPESDDFIDCRQIQECEPIQECSRLPRPNVFPPNIFEMNEMKGDNCNPCDNFRPIKLPPIDFYGKL